MTTDSLTHHGVKGMKWGRRKSRSSSGTSKKSSTKKDTSAKRKKILTDSRKQTLKRVAKTTAIVAGKVAAASVLGAVGAYSVGLAIDAFTDYRDSTVLGPRHGGYIQVNGGGKHFREYKPPYLVKGKIKL